MNYERVGGGRGGGGAKRDGLRGGLRGGGEGAWKRTEHGPRCSQA